MTRRLAEIVRKVTRGATVTSTQDFFPQILQGGDPIGDFFSTAVPASHRRLHGATLTPPWLVELQLDQISQKCVPNRVVDAGAGTGRYALRAAMRWPRAEVIAIEQDATLADTIRLNASISGAAIEIMQADYLSIGLPKIDGVTAFVGNPPYVRHHDISAAQKHWYSVEMKRLGLPHSQLAGLHLYFYLKSYLLSGADDVGSFVTAAEWTETNYGEGMRRLFCLMGGDALIRVSPKESVFDDALTTSAIVGWSAGHSGDVSVADLHDRSINERFTTNYSELEGLSKWPGFGYDLPIPVSNEVRFLGEFFDINRGQVTGCNDVWIAMSETEKLIPQRYLFPCVTDAREIIESRGVLNDSSKLRRVIDLPADLAELSRAERDKVNRFLEIAELVGAKDSYIARHRKPWWRVGLKAAPPIMMSYMGRRPPRFSRNACGARLLNIAHGLTPRRPMARTVQDQVVRWLNENVALTTGRTYGGGLVKFEPGDAMKIPVPTAFAAA